MKKVLEIKNVPIITSADEPIGYEHVYCWRSNKNGAGAVYFGRDRLIPFGTYKERILEEKGWLW